MKPEGWFILAVIFLALAFVGWLLGRRRNLPMLILFEGALLLASNWLRSSAMRSGQSEVTVTHFILYLLCLAAFAGIAVGGLLGWIAQARRRG